MLTAQQIRAAIAAYIDCAMWLEHCCGTASHDGCRGEDCDTSFQDIGYSVLDISSGAMADMIDDMRAFISGCEEEREHCFDSMDAGQVGHDFWLTRNSHGAGFWDRGLGELGEWLTSMAKPYGKASLYMGDDGEIHYD